MDTFTPDQIATSLFPPVEFVVKQERFMWWAPLTPGVGNTLIVARRQGSDWVPFYGNGREVTVQEFRNRGGVVGYVKLHVEEVNRALAQYFRATPEAQEQDALVAQMVIALRALRVEGTKIVM